MYKDYATIDARHVFRIRAKSLLQNYHKVSPQFVDSLVKQLVASNENVGGGVESSDEPKNASSILKSDEDVHWIMEVLCYGLTYPLTDNDQIDSFRDCVLIYCQWFQALAPRSLASIEPSHIPRPIMDEPNIYCLKIIGHMYNIFVQLFDNLKPETVNDEHLNERIQRQALACHRFLRLIITVTTDKDNRLDIDTWECLLTFLLAINEELVEASSNNAASQHIDDRIISTLFQGWLQACVYLFPSPSYWRTFQEVCIKLRYREALIQQWNRVNICLASRLCQVIYHSDSDNNNNAAAAFHKLDLTSPQYAQYNDIICSLDVDTLKQCWYHFLQIIGNPIELAFPEIIFKDNHSMVRVQYNGSYNNNSTNNINMYQQQLPALFHKAIKGLCTLVDIFLGMPNIQLKDLEIDLSSTSRASVANLAATTTINSMTVESTPPPEKRRSAHTLVQPTSSNLSVNNNKQQQQQQPVRPQRNSRIIIDSPALGETVQLVLPSLHGTLICQNRIKPTSLLDVFGKWLFQAAMVCTPGNFAHEVLELTLGGGLNAGRRPKLTATNLERFEAGQAEAIGALCRIFCCKKQEDDIHLVLSKKCHRDLQKIRHYLNSFYIALRFGLAGQPAEGSFRGQLVSSILVNSVGFFEADLPGSKILIESYLKAIETFLIKKDNTTTNPNEVIIRRACIRILISLISLPLHYKDLEIKDTLQEGVPANTFQGLFPQLASLLIHALHKEHDSANVQLVLGGLLFIVEDAVHSNGDHFAAAADDNHDEHHLQVDGGAQTLDKDPVKSLLELFKTRSKTSEQENNMSHEEMTSSLFLLIISFVAEVLCKTLTTSDYNVSLTALEILSALGRINHHQQRLCHNRCKLCIKQIFTFIQAQCDKPVTHHSKDMHSTIVAAYQCLAVWVRQHSHLLKDRAYVVLLIELIELGISGFKSSSKTSATTGGGAAANVIYKADKTLRPTSLRVREAAEFLLITLIGQLEDKQLAQVAESSLLSQVVNESFVAARLTDREAPATNIDIELCQHFRFFATKNSLLISIYEGRPKDQGDDVADAGNDEEETIVIIRSPFGKYCWLFKYQHISRARAQGQQTSAAAADGQNPSPSFYRAKLDPSGQRAIHFNYFPEYYDNMCTSKFENSVLRLSTYIAQLKERQGAAGGAGEDFDTMRNLIDKIETNLRYEKSRLTMGTTNNNNKKEVTGGRTVGKTFEPARLILSQFKVLHSADGGGATAATNNKEAAPAADFYSINTTDSFVEQLAKLDTISTKNNDLVVLLFVPKDFGEERDIFEATAQQYRTNLVYQQFLHSLGQSVEVGQTSAGVLLFHWFDISHELLFACPTTAEGRGRPKQQQQQQEATSASSKLSLANLIDDDIESIRHQLFNLLQESDRNRYHILHNNGCDLKLFILWIESMEDFDRLPFKSLLANGSNDSSADKIHLILVAPLKNGLFRVTTQALSAKSPTIAPIIGQMVLSKHLLAPYIRLTALNLFRRRRMNTDFQVPYVKRRNKIQELVARHKHDDRITEWVLLGN